MAFRIVFDSDPNKKTRCFPVSNRLSISGIISVPFTSGLRPRPSNRAQIFKAIPSNNNVVLAARSVANDLSMYILWRLLKFTCAMMYGLAAFAEDKLTIISAASSSDPETSSMPKREILSIRSDFLSNKLKRNFI